MNKNEKTLGIQVRSKTWTRDSHGLFDYENNQVKTTTLIISSNGKLMRRKNEVCFVGQSESKQIVESEIEEIRELGNFIYLSNKFFLSSKLETLLPVNNQTLTDLQEKVWYVVKTNNSNMSVVNTNNSYLSQYKYELRKNDIIKLGRIKFLIRDMNIVDGSYITTEETFRPYQECEKASLLDSETCRICFSNTYEDSNPLISICKCKGSINHIHLNCLQLWLEQKLSKKEIVNKIGISYTIKSFNCELCKEPYPTTIKFNDKLYHLLDYFVPEGQNYIILESLNSIKENQYPLSIHVLMFLDNGDSFVLGRGHESDVRISDISVSRSHAKITFKDKTFKLEDTGSKFGTLVLAKDAVEVTNEPVILQIGRSLFSIANINPDAIPKAKKNSLKEVDKIDSSSDNKLDALLNFDNVGLNNLNIDNFLLDYKESDNGDLNNLNVNKLGKKEDEEDSDKGENDS